jgi:hypothetical protein
VTVFPLAARGIQSTRIAAGKRSRIAAAEVIRWTIALPFWRVAVVQHRAFCIDPGPSRSPHRTACTASLRTSTSPLRRSVDWHGAAMARRRMTARGITARQPFRTGPVRGTTIAATARCITDTVDIDLAFAAMCSTSCDSARSKRPGPTEILFSNDRR